MTADLITAPRRPSRSARGAHWWIVLTSAAIAVFAPLPYMTTSLEGLGRDPDALAANYVTQPAWFQVALYVHIFGSALALVLSPIQLSARVRARVPRLHRVTGRIVLLAILLGGTSALVIAPANDAGPIGVAGFGLLGLSWLGCAGLALRSVLRRDFAAHRRWAIRTFALTYAAVMLRLWLLVLITAQSAAGVADQMAFDRAYLLVPFLCWVPNLVVAERFLRLRRR
ncbi:DUF2306 domain-containing protein [Kineosporia rhizophila]|uniref:DUF2306 domain-containing protein n=1 Tax=Kineosporia rhizophila TaxID=84633 RepID=UPI001E45F1E3|nr:DUF2306 domain-containing protein [Kineosporia rhizophila]MCE0538200.1 DUF2306 domain-containing protein [Kineosporia rhizophila]